MCRVSRCISWLLSSSRGFGIADLRRPQILAATASYSATAERAPSCSKALDTRFTITAGSRGLLRWQPVGSRFVTHLSTPCNRQSREGIGCLSRAWPGPRKWPHLVVLRRLAFDTGRVVAQRLPVQVVGPVRFHGSRRDIGGRQGPTVFSIGHDPSPGFVDAVARFRTRSSA